MKNKTTTILSVAVVLITVLCTTGPAKAGPPARPNLQGGAPTVISYQGQVIADDSPYNGTGYFKFAIVDEGGAISYWSNDGSSSDGGEPESGVSLTVTGGLFNVLLGDTTLANMTESLTAEAFGETARYLRVWFSADDSTYLLLDPDRRITAAPYALQAQEAVSAASAAYATNADRLDGQHGSYYQARVSGACAVGSTVRAINADGTVVCQAGALNRAVAPTGNANAALDSHGVGTSTSVTIGVDGLGLISYCDSTHDTLKIAHCDDPACTSATVTTVAVVSCYNATTSVTIGADGLPLISVDRRIVHCSDPACTTYAVNVTGLPHEVPTSVTIGTDGLPLISSGGNDLHVVHCEDPACASSTMTYYAPPGGGGVGDNSVTIGIDGLGLISYYNDTSLWAAHCLDTACTTATLSLVDSGGGADVGMYNSLTIGATGQPLISYYDSDYGHLKTAACSRLDCTSSITLTLKTISILDGTSMGSDVGGYTSITVGTDGLPLISYYDFTNGDLKVAQCRNSSCTAAITTTLDSADDIGGYTSLTIGADGLPLISYYDFTHSELRVAHCGSAWCTPYFRRR